MPVVTNKLTLCRAQHELKLLFYRPNVAGFNQRLTWWRPHDLRLEPFDEDKPGRL
jgi:hypothetical protein